MGAEFVLGTYWFGSKISRGVMSSGRRRVQNGRGTADGRLLDGRNRLHACYVAGQEVRFRRLDPPDPFPWSWGQNVERRHRNTLKARADRRTRPFNVGPLVPVLVE